MQYSTEANLAWSLIDAAKPALDARERNHVFVSVGAGDSFTAMRILLKLIATKQIALQLSLIQSCAKWLDAYALHEDHERLRQLIECFAVRAGVTTHSGSHPAVRFQQRSPRRARSADQRIHLLARN